MRCDRCHGLMIRDSLRSTDNDYRKVTYARCINCGRYHFARDEHVQVTEFLNLLTTVAA